MAERVSIDTLSGLLSRGASVKEKGDGVVVAGEREQPSSCGQEEPRRTRPKSMTPEYKAFLGFAERCGWSFKESECVRFLGLGKGCLIERREDHPKMEEVTEKHLLASKPLIVKNSLAGWKAREWTPEFFSEAYPGQVVIANDRAPARVKDRESGRPQASVKTTLSQYVEYMRRFGHKESEGVPLYLNGWHAFKDHAELVDDIASPPWIEDHTRMILQEIDKAISSKNGVRAAPHWVRDTDILLNKVFMGPAGNITRLHYDAHRAHGWLAQIKGRKLFLLFPPDTTNDASLLYPLEGEATTQSPIDPLDAESVEKYPRFKEARMHYAILEEGETLLIPDGWWHYAVSLAPSITVMRNFYNALSNVQGLVNLFANLRPAKK